MNIAEDMLYSGGEYRPEHLEAGNEKDGINALHSRDGI